MLNLPDLFLKDTVRAMPIGIWLLSIRRQVPARGCQVEAVGFIGVESCHNPRNRTVTFTLGIKIGFIQAPQGVLVELIQRDR